MRENASANRNRRHDGIANECQRAQKTAASICARNGSPTHPSAEARERDPELESRTDKRRDVLDTCLAETGALMFPSSASVSSWLLRTLTSANSQATKKPLSTTRRRNDQQACSNTEPSESQ